GGGTRRHANSNGRRSPRSRQRNQRASSALPIRRQHGQTESPERSTGDPALSAVQTRLMFQAKPSLTPEVIRLHTHEGDELIAHLPRLQAYLCKDRPTPLSCDPTWLRVLRLGLRCTPYCLEAVQDDQTRGILPLAYVKTMLFGRFLVSLPYLHSGGAV